MERFNSDPMGMLQEVLGEELGAEYFVFDAHLIAILFSAQVRPVDNMASFTTMVGKKASDIWECASHQVTKRLTKSMPDGP